jgi:hypothetical protein
MVFKPNYGARRADRDRAQKARNEEKLKERQERAARRKAEDETSNVVAGEGEHLEPARAAEDNKTNDGDRTP